MGHLRIVVALKLRLVRKVNSCHDTVQIVMVVIFPKRTTFFKIEEVQDSLNKSWCNDFRMTLNPFGP